jgi:hypothetical protein
MGLAAGSHSAHRCRRNGRNVSRDTIKVLPEYSIFQVRLRSVELVYFATPLRFGPMLLSQRIL